MKKNYLIFIFGLFLTGLFLSQKTFAQEPIAKKVNCKVYGTSQGGNVTACQCPGTNELVSPGSQCLNSFADCNINDRECVSETTFRYCLNYEWQPPRSCASGQICQNG